MQALQDVGRVYNQTMVLLTSLAKRGLVHCDFNEFNILVCLLCLPALLTRPSLHYCGLHEDASMLFTGEGHLSWCLSHQACL